MNFYEHHIGDYAQATAHLSFVEDAAYSRLIRKYYAEEKPLPADLRAVHRLVAARTEEERAAVTTVLEEFFTLEDDGWHSKRCDEEIAKYREKAEKARASAQARWNRSNANAMRTHAKADANASGGDANASETHNGRNAHQTPDTSIKNTLSPREAPAPRPATGLDPRLEIPGLKQHHPEDWKPDLKRLASELRIAGLPMPDQESLQRSLRKFNLHNAGKALTANQQYGKLTAWLEGDHRNAQRTPPRDEPPAGGAPAAGRQPTAVERIRAKAQQRYQELGIAGPGKRGG